MGDKELHDAAAQSQEIASYTVISFPGTDLPKQYEGLIYSKWLRSLRHGNDYFKLIDPMAYYSSYRPYVARVLSDSRSVVRMAVLSDDHDVVLGFSVCRHNILDYIFVLRIRMKVPTGIEVTDFRRKGIGRSLLPKGIDTITHLTGMGLTIWGNKFPEWKFNPFA